MDGPTLFSRFAFPPNELGLCGPDDARFLAEVAAGGESGGIHEVLKAFTGAYPYLSLIAEDRSIGDPLHPAVVEAYWLGHGATTHVDLLTFGNHLRDRFLPRAHGDGWMHIEHSLESVPHPTHAFHVFGVYPWLGKLRDGMVDPSLRILDRCRIRWGTVEAVDGFSATVTSLPLTWSEGRLALGDPIREQVNLYAGLAPSPGDVLALHWDWACAILDPSRVASLKADTVRILKAIDTFEPTAD